MYSFYLDGVPLPSAPEKLTLKIKGNNKTLILVNDGEINFLKSPGLTEVSFEAAFPMLGGYPFTSYQGGFQPPDYYLGKLERLMSKRKPFRFIVSRVSPKGRLLFDTNLKVSLEDYEIKEAAKDGFDVAVSISLKQYRDFATKKVALPPVIKVSSAYITEDRPAAGGGGTYTVKKGDCLWAIAQSHMGNGSKYPELYAANKADIDARNSGTGNPKYTIYPGQVFTIP